MIYNFGSINVDLVSNVNSSPGPGETVQALDFQKFIGGKGLNFTVAAQAWSQHVIHIGAINRHDSWVKNQLQQYQISTKYIHMSKETTGTAIVIVEPDGENRIIVNSGANSSIPTDFIESALNKCNESDWLVFQNETNGHDTAINCAKRGSAKIAYIPAPFDCDLVNKYVGQIDLLIVNEHEYAAFLAEVNDLEKLLGKGLNLVVTRGRAGSEWISSTKSIKKSALLVNSVDTTAAGDTFAGTLIGCLSNGISPEQAMEFATVSASLSTMKHGAACSIPNKSSVLNYIDNKDNH